MLERVSGHHGIQAVPWLLLAADTQRDGAAEAAREAERQENVRFESGILKLSSSEL